MYHKSKTGWEEMILCSTFLLKVDRDNQNRVTRKTIKGSLHKNDVLLRADHFTQIYCWCLITFESFHSGFTFSPYVILLKWAAWAKSWQTICHLLNNSRFAPLPLLCEGWGDEIRPENTNECLEAPFPLWRLWVWCMQIHSFNSERAVLPSCSRRC